MHSIVSWSDGNDCSSAKISVSLFPGVKTPRKPFVYGVFSIFTRGLNWGKEEGDPIPYASAWEVVAKFSRSSWINS